MIRFLLPVALISLTWLHVPARADVKGIALVRIDNPKRGSIPNIIAGYGIVMSDNTLTRSFQRDGQVSNIMAEVGDQFKKGDPLLEFGAAPAAVVAYEQAKTALRLAQGTLARTKQLFEQKLATRDQLDIAEKAASDAQLTKEMYEKQGATTSEILAAPFDGVVTAISVSKGDRVAAGTALMTLAETDKLRLSIGIEPAQIDRIKVGLAVNLESLLPGSRPIETRVKGVGAAIDPKTKLVPVAVELADKSALPGEGFKAEILTGKFEGWVISRDSVQVDKKGAFVFQIDEEHAKRVDVNVLGSAGDTSVIEGDIDPQKKLVLFGGYQIADGDAVRTELAPAVAAAEKDEGADQVEGKATE
ncbi:MAG TPA: efflux RND transporter periplasmic adaptor subunit [Xanthobacteraceae bacterium]|jgi:RND family efflux transporter MFP subunit